MGGIFICYRRRDAAWAGRLSDSLKSDFGRLNIFRDIEDIPPGVEFDKHITEAVSGCDVLVAIIGPDWLSATDKFGKRKLDNPNDLVRLEIAAALKRNVRLIPILVSGGTMPEPEELPADLQQFARRQAYELTDARWTEDCRRLFGVLKPLVSQESKLRRYCAAAFGVLAVAAAVGGYGWIGTEHDIAIHNDPAQIATAEQIGFGEKAAVGGAAAAITAADKVAADKVAAVKAAAEKAAAEQAAAEQAAAEQAAAQKAAAEKAAAEQAAAEQASSEQAASEQAAAEQAAAEKAAAEKAAAEKAAAEKAAAEKAAAQKAAAEKAAAQKAAAEKAAADKVAAEKAAADKVAAEKAAADKVAAEKTAADKTVAATAALARTSIRFSNYLDGPVNVFWKDQIGRETLYMNLAPRTSYEQSTYVGHSWVVRDATSGAIVVAAQGTDAPRDVNIGVGKKSVTNKAVSVTGAPAKTSIRFSNNLDGPVNVFWKDYNDGRETLYMNLAPRTSYEQSTYVGHSWVVRDAKSGAIALTIYGAESAQTASIGAK
jgi:hypothetical protein